MTFCVMTRIDVLVFSKTTKKKKQKIDFFLLFFSHSSLITVSLTFANTIGKHLT